MVESLAFSEQVLQFEVNPTGLRVVESASELELQPKVADRCFDLC